MESWWDIPGIMLNGYLVLLRIYTPIFFRDALIYPWLLKSTSVITSSNIVRVWRQHNLGFQMLDQHETLFGPLEDNDLIVRYDCRISYSLLGELIIQ